MPELQQPRRAASYIRESTEEQGRGYSPDGQRQAIARYAANHGMQLVEEYIDFETGRHADKRPDFQRLIEHAMEHRFEIVLIKRGPVSRARTITRGQGRRCAGGAAQTSGPRTGTRPQWTNEQDPVTTAKAVDDFRRWERTGRARLRGRSAHDTHAKIDSPQLSRRVGGSFVARGLRSERASRSTIVRQDTKCRRSDVEASEGTTWLSCRQVRVPTDRLEHPMLPTRIVCCYRRGKFQRSHNCVWTQGRPQSPYVV